VKFSNLLRFASGNVMETKKRLLQPHGEIVTIGQTFPSAERQTPPVAKNAFLADATAPLQPAEFPKRRDLFVLNRGRRNLTVCPQGELAGGSLFD